MSGVLVLICRLGGTEQIVVGREIRACKGGVPRLERIGGRWCVRLLRAIHASSTENTRSISRAKAACDFVKSLAMTGALKGITAKRQSF